MILALLLAATPPSQAYLEIRQNEVSKGYARIINCSGSGVTCAVNTATAEATLTVSASSSDAGSGGNWDGGPAIPACSAGYVLDADGGVLYCINTIANATLAATATALAADPGDCDAGQYAVSINASGTLTCSQVTTSQLGGTVTNSQLASSYSGVGACSSSHWVSALNANAAGSCTQPNYTDLAGCEPGQGVAGALQYNTSSCEGGVSNVTSNASARSAAATRGVAEP